MSKLITIRAVKIDESTSGAITTKIDLFYSDNTKDQLECSFNASPEERMMLVAHHLQDVNSPTYHHTLGERHVRTLIKFRKACAFHAERQAELQGHPVFVNSLHRRADLDAAGQSLTKDEEANLTYLRYFGLLIPDDNAKAGYWLITRKGHRFLSGGEVIARGVIVKNNSVKGHEGDLVSLGDVLKGAPTWPHKDELDIELPAKREQVQAGLFV